MALSPILLDLQEEQHVSNTTFKNNAKLSLYADYSKAIDETRDRQLHEQSLIEKSDERLIELNNKIKDTYDKIQQMQKEMDKYDMEYYNLLKERNEHLNEISHSISTKYSDLVDKIVEDYNNKLYLIGTMYNE